MEVPKKVEQQVVLYQQLQQQAQIIISQKQQLEMQIREIERAVEELDKAKSSDAVYKSIGSILVKAESKEAVVKELKEEKEALGVRVKTLDRQIERVKEKLDNLQKDLSEQLKQEELKET